MGYVHFPNISVPNCSLHYSSVQSSAEQCGSAQCSTEQSSTVQCSVLQCCSALSLDRTSGQIKSCSCRESGVAEEEEKSVVLVAGRSGWGPWCHTHTPLPSPLLSITRTLHISCHA